MGFFYFDIETTGLDASNCKIISIQFQKFNWNFEPCGDLTILREWRSSEKNILSEFLAQFKPWQFIPVGCNLQFDKHFISYRSKFHGFSGFDFEHLIKNYPSIDVHSAIVLMNRGKFAGSSLSNFSEKESDGNMVPKWYEDKEYDKIEDYVEKEAIAFSSFLKELNKRLLR